MRLRMFSVIFGLFDVLAGFLPQHRRSLMSIAMTQRNCQHAACVYKVAGKKNCANICTKFKQNEEGNYSATLLIAHFAMNYHKVHDTMY